MDFGGSKVSLSLGLILVFFAIGIVVYDPANKSLQLLADSRGLSLEYILGKTRHRKRHVAMGMHSEVSMPLRDQIVPP